jgi:glutamate-1-semialdehyde 2,1-aminomutase
MLENKLVMRSREIFSTGVTYTPGGINSFSRAIWPPLVFSEASGAYLFDVDGNRYIDYHAAFGPIILGHCHSGVNQAVTEAITKLDLVGLGSTELELKLATKIIEHLPSAEMVHLCNTGTEATYNALRLARAVTGRNKVLKFQGCFHGSHDYLCMNVISPRDRLGKIDPCSAGMLPGAVASTLVAQFNNIAQVESIVNRNADDLAAIILEPIAHNVGCILPKQEFLKGLRQIATERNIILIFDEVITGFRHGLGGYQKICGVTPDLTTLAKSMANGFPCAAIAGKKELMNRFNTAGGDVFFAGTYNGHPVGTAAALATIEALEDGKVYEHLFGLGEQVRNEISQIINKVGIKAFVAGFGSVFTVYFMQPQLDSYDDLLRNQAEVDRFFRGELIRNGILVNPLPLKRYHLTASHTDEDVEITIHAIRNAMAKAARKFF